MATAYAALVSLYNNLYLIQNHPRHSFSFEDEQIQSLSENALFLIDFMETYDDCHGNSKQVARALDSENALFLIDFMETYDDCHGNSKQVARALDSRIARAAHAAEDVIESHVVDQIRAGSTLHGKRTSRFLLDLQKVTQGMDFVCRKASEVLEAQSELPKSSAAATFPSTPLSLSLSLSPQKNSNSMVGFDEILLQLLDMLTGEPSSRRVIPIVGMGGIGKTTLATNAFQHPLIVQHFDVCLWATISQQYSAEKILMELLSRLRKSTSETVNEIGQKLHKSLYGRRYLIVLDDMWSVEAWYEIKLFFPNEDNGSRIVVTSRHSYVADHLDSLHLKMSCLDVNNSWDLFCQKAFAEIVCTPDLEEIGKMIVEKCGGLPLAIVVVGGHLRKSSMALEYWESVARDMPSVLTWAEHESCLDVLSLSYSYMPAYLKPCFLFMGVFPEDEVIYMWDILRLWIAEGFVVEPHEYSSMEEAAEDYLWDLYGRNLIIVDELGCNGEIITFQIHDLVRELCLKLAQKDGFIYVLDSSTTRAMSRGRRVLILNEKVQPNIFHNPISQVSDDLVRSLICKGGQLSRDLKLLRVLCKVDSASIDEAMFEQVNLRLLKVDLAYKSRPTLYLPSSISQLWNLQILIITASNQSIVVAPYEIWEMLQLRHVEVDPVCLVDPLPTDNVEQEEELVLRHLHTLLRVENMRWSEEVCKRIPNIKEVQISYRDLGRDCEEARSYYCPQNLGRFQQLEYIVCQFDGSSNSKWREFALSLTFPSTLKWLSLAGSCLDWEELTTMVGSLPQLLSLELHLNSVTGSSWTPVEGKFLRLKYLSLSTTDDLIYWNAESSHFPVLENLHLRNLSKLDEFPSGIGEVPTLEWIEMDSCSLSSSISAMRMMAEQEKLGNDGFQLHVYFRDDKETLEKFKLMVREEGLITTNLFLREKTSNKPSMIGPKGNSR